MENFSDKMLEIVVDQFLIFFGLYANFEKVTYCKSLDMAREKFK